MNRKAILEQILVFKKHFNKYCDVWRKLERAKAIGVPYELLKINYLNISLRDKPLEEQSSDLLEMLNILKPYLISLIDNESINTLESSITFKTTEYAQADKINFAILIIEEVISKLEDDDEDSEIKRADALSISNNVDNLMQQYLYYLHPEIKESSAELFLSGKYHESVDSAAKAVLHYIKVKTNLPDDTSNLVNKAFSTDNKILVFVDDSTIDFKSKENETLKNEQSGFLDMLKGFVIGVRNVTAHTSPKSDISQRMFSHKNKVFEYLVMASLFCRRIDDTYKVSP